MKLKRSKGWILFPNKFLIHGLEKKELGLCYDGQHVITGTSAVLQQDR